MSIKKRISVSIFAVSLFCFMPSARSWVLILNGTSCSGKTTLARNFQKIIQQPTEVLQLDTEADELLKEELEPLGYCYDGKTSVRDWFDSLPKEVKKQFNYVNDNVKWVILQKRLIKKAQKLDHTGVNVIIDTGLKNKADYELFATKLPSDHTYFVLLYAPIKQLLKNLIARNDSDNSKEEQRPPLGPFYQFFFLLAERCEVTSPEKLDILTKEDFEFVFEQLEIIIKNKDKFDDFWVSTKDFKKIKSIIDHEFFHTCWSYTPFFFKNWMPWYWIKTWLPCYCGGKDVIAIKPKVSFYDFVINTGTTSAIECAKILDEWLSTKTNT